MTAGQRRARRDNLSPPRLGLAVGVLTATMMLMGCRGEEERLRRELTEATEREAALREELDALMEEIAPLRDAQAAAEAARREEEAEEVAREATWASLRGRYRCSGGFIDGMTLRDGYARFSMGGYEQLTGNVSYPARVRGGKLYITDPQRGAVGWSIRDDGRILVPDSLLLARRCVKR